MILLGIRITTRGNWDKTRNWLKRMERNDYLPVIEQFGEVGCRYLAEYTPKDTGKTAKSWRYEIKRDTKGITISWLNDNMDDHGNASVVILIQYGHGTGTGGYVAAVDFINPAIKPVFENLAEAVWKEVCKS